MVASKDQKKEPVIVRINGKWVNLTAWSRTHPGGSAPLERFRNKDATDAFISLHSEEAHDMLDKMKEVAAPFGADIDSDTPAALAFREWRDKLKKEGWFERNWLWDAAYISIILFLFIVGTYIAYDHPIIASLLIGFGMEQAGWLGHDYVHGRGKASYWLGRLIGGLGNAFSSEWWSNKHNTHHVHTNQVGVDADIANDPILHLYIPGPDREYWFRSYQHIYYHIVYAFLFVSWRIQSLQWALEHSEKLELFFMALNYLWLFYLPVPVAIGSIIWGGWLVAEVVTASHQSEEMLEGLSYTFVEDQFATTRDVVLDSYFMNWLWGGMQYQLIHHLFPTMPKYRYRALQPQVHKFAKENGLEYKTASCLEILKMNYDTMKKFAAKK